MLDLEDMKIFFRACALYQLSGKFSTIEQILEFLIFLGPSSLLHLFFDVIEVRDCEQQQKTRTGVFTKLIKLAEGKMDKKERMIWN